MYGDEIMDYVYLSSAYCKEYYKDNMPSSFINKFPLPIPFTSDQAYFNRTNKCKISLASMYYDKAKDIAINPMTPLIVTCDIISPSYSGNKAIQILKKIYPKSNWEQTFNGPIISHEYHNINRFPHTSTIAINIYDDSMKPVSFTDGTLYMTLHVDPQT